MLGALVGCEEGARCILPPCAMPTALMVTVTSAASGAPIANALVAATSPAHVTVPCGGTCHVPGLGGTYEIEISAPGYRPERRSVQVRGMERECGCPIVETERVAVALVPAVAAAGPRLARAPAPTHIVRSASTPTARTDAWPDPSRPS